MATEAGCGLCGWHETFDEHGEAKQAAVDHNCNPDTDENPPAWIKDVAANTGAESGGIH